MSKEDIKKAFDDFENEKYSDSEARLKTIFKKKANDHLKDTLKLKNDVIKIDKEDEDEDDGGDDQ
jgi:hypothetical protein